VTVKPLTTHEQIFLREFLSENRFPFFGNALKKNGRALGPAASISALKDEAYSTTIRGAVRAELPVRDWTSAQTLAAMSL